MRGVTRFGSLAQFRLNGRLLDTIIVLAPEQPTDDHGSPPRLSIEDLSDMLLSSLYAATSLGLAVAAAIGGERPLPPPYVEAWINGPLDTEALYIDRRWDTVARNQAEYRFSRLQPEDVHVAALHEVVKEWLHPLLLDVGALNFEEMLVELQAPRWSEHLTDGM